MKIHVPTLQMIAGGAVPSLRELLSSSNEAFQARQSKIVVRSSKSAFIDIWKEMSAAVLGNLCLLLSTLRWRAGLCRKLFSALRS